MNAVNEESALRQDAYAISGWEREGGADAHDGIDCDYGRRIESDRSWTVYHVFSGAPARIDGRFMLEHFQAKWMPVRVKKIHQNKNLELFHVSMKREKALGLSCQEATHSMVSTNRSNVVRRKQRGKRLASTARQEQQS